MIIALRVLKEGRETWLEGMGVRPLFILTMEELSEWLERSNMEAYMRGESGQSNAFQQLTTSLLHYYSISLRGQQLRGPGLKALPG